MIASAEDRMFRYWLGTLDSPEREQLENDYFSNDEKYELLLTAEDDLIDAYVRRELSASERQLFEKHYLKIPRRRWKVQLARELQAWNRDRALHQGGFWPVVWRGALAAAFVGAAALAATLWTQRMRPAEEPSDVRDEAALRSVRHPLPSEGEANELPAARELEPERVAGPETSNPPLGKSKVLAFVLKPGLLRARSSTNRLVIPRGTSQLELQIETERKVKGAFRAVIRSPEDVETWRGEFGSAAVKGSGGVVVVKLPASAVDSDDYILTISALGPRGELTTAGEYFFHVVK
jgi:hypothetical protein